jgi:hypothetical protein
MLARTIWSRNNQFECWSLDTDDTSHLALDYTAVITRVICLWRQDAIRGMISALLYTLRSLLCLSSLHHSTLPILFLELDLGPGGKDQFFWLSVAQVPTGWLSMWALRPFYPTLGQVCWDPWPCALGLELSPFPLLPAWTGFVFTLCALLFIFHAQPPRMIRILQFHTRCSRAWFENISKLGIQILISK